jgi:signal peptidase I
LYAVLAFVAARRVRIDGRSMYPVLLPGERALFDRLAFVRDRPRRGDIVLAVRLARPGRRMVKRIAGAPGDLVQDGGEPRLLARGEYWLLGDNPAESTDSRTLGPFGRRQLLARGWIVYWPAERYRTL